MSSGNCIFFSCMFGILVRLWRSPKLTKCMSMSWTNSHTFNLLFTQKHNPALAKIKSLSCTRSLDKWHFARCAVMSSIQLFNLINSSSPRLGPQLSPAAAFSEHRFAIHAHQYVLLNKEINPILYYTIPLPHLYQRTQL